MGTVIKQSGLNNSTDQGSDTVGYAYSFTEAPASINFRFDYDGYNCQLTLRDASGIGVIEKLSAAISFLEKRGVQPGQAKVSTNGNESAPLCPTHNKPMRSSQHGGWFCPVKIADDDGAGKPVYCKQKVK